MIKLFRPQQHNLVLSFQDNAYPKDEAAALTQMLQTINTAPTARAYEFPSLKALHEFEALITGFDVVHDW